MRFLECDDLVDTNDDYICSAGYDECRLQRYHCKTADDFFYHEDGMHYYQRFIIYTSYEDGEKVYLLRDKEHKFDDLPLKNRDNAKSLIIYLYKLIDEIDKLGGYSEDI